ncbi:MAG: RDD family protein [Phycisphaeraceae bacterium JB051]
MARFQCPLCESYAVNTGRIYGHEVCRKCGNHFEGNRMGGVWIDMALVQTVLALPLAVLASHVSFGPVHAHFSETFWMTLALLYFYNLWLPIFVILQVILMSTSFGVSSSWVLWIFVLVISRSLILPAVMLLRDGFGMRTPGRWLTGLQVIDLRTGESISMLQSIKRNAILFIPSPILVVMLGKRIDRHWGDRWAGTKVVIRRKRHHRIFAGNTQCCEFCRYDLTGNTTGICPECGKVVSSQYHVDDQSRD